MAESMIWVECEADVELSEIPGEDVGECGWAGKVEGASVNGCDWVWQCPSCDNLNETTMEPPERDDDRY